MSMTIPKLAAGSDSFYVFVKRPLASRWIPREHI